MLKIEGNYIKIRVGVAENAAPALFLCPKMLKNAGVLFVVLCSNKEQHKHCVVRDLNLNACKLFKTRTKLYPFYIYRREYI
jgi:hypothetical protein